MKKKALVTMLAVSMMAAGLAGCGGSTTAATQAAATTTAAAAEAAATEATEAKYEAATEAEKAPAAADGELIRVGIINNDHNESGYRTANDADMKAMFTKENGYDASFAYSRKTTSRLRRLRNSSRTRWITCFCPRRIPPAGTACSRMPRTQASA